MAVNFNEDNLHVVKVGESAQGEFRGYLHEIETDAQATGMYDDWTLRCNPTWDDPEYYDWIDDSDDWSDHSMIDYDDYGDYLDVERAKYHEMKDWGSFDAGEIRRHEEEMAWREYQHTRMFSDSKILDIEYAVERPV